MDNVTGRDDWIIQQALMWLSQRSTDVRPIGDRYADRADMETLLHERWLESRLGRRRRSQRDTSL